jgi:hypothetical protein
MRVLKRLESTDDALHGTHDDSFLSLHYRVAADRINELTAHAKESGSPEPPIGTGGGGVPYLGHVRKNLIPLFPNLIANRGLVDYPEWGWMEHAPS